jgi:hypothetical protein
MGFTFPLVLGPHIEYPNQRFPLPHLQGVIGAAQQMRDWAAGLLAKYELALGAAKIPVPQAVSTHLGEMKSELKLGDFHLGMGVDMVGQITKGQVTDQLNEKAEGFLWEAMESFFKVSQLIANPKAPSRPTHRRSDTPNYTQNQARPPISPRPIPAIPAHPVPDVSSLMNQVTAAPTRMHAAPAQPTPDAIDLLNQVTATPVPEQSTLDVTDLLNQVTDTQAATPAQPTPDVSDLLNQVNTTPASIQPTPQTKSSHGENRNSYLNKPASDDDLLDDVCGVKKEDT